MKQLYEIMRRFPEVEPLVHDGDAELPTLMIDHIMEWLRTVASPHFSPDVIRRVVDFDRRCRSQPRGKTVEDDIFTMEFVAFHETLFQHDELLPLIPHLMTKEEVLQGVDYFTTWVGADRYQAGVRAFDARPRPAKRSARRRQRGT